MIPFALTTIIVFGGAGFFILLGGHDWLPKLLKRDTVPPESYIWGVSLGILLPYIGWLTFYHLAYTPHLPAWLAALAFLSITAISGAGTLAAYRLDRRHGDHLWHTLQRTSLDLIAEKIQELRAALQYQEEDDTIPANMVPAADILTFLKSLEEALVREPPDQPPHRRHR